MKLGLAIAVVALTFGCAIRSTEAPPTGYDAVWLEGDALAWEWVVKECRQDLDLWDWLQLQELFRPVEVAHHDLARVRLQGRPIEGAIVMLRRSLREFEGWMVLPPYGICTQHLPRARQQSRVGG